MAFQIIFILLALTLLLWQISLLVAIAKGAPTIYSKNQVIIKAFQSVNLQKGQLVVDLGCGNARSLILASRIFGGRGIGVEISPFYYVLAKLNVLVRGESKNIKIKYGNLRNHKTIIKDADIFFLYLFDKIVAEIEPWVFEQAKQHAKIISLAFPFKGHKGTRIEARPPVYIYKK